METVVFGLLRHDSNLRPPGYELLLGVFSVAVQRLLRFLPNPDVMSPIHPDLLTC